MATLALIVPLGSTGGPVDPGFGVPAPPSGGGAPVYPSHPIYTPPVYPDQGLPVYPSTGPVPPGWANRPVDPGYGRPSWGAGHPSHPIAGVPPMYPSGQPLPPGWRPVDPGYGHPVFGPRPSHPIAGVPPMYPSGQPVPPGGGPVDPGYGIEEGGGGGGFDPVGGYIFVWHPRFGFAWVPVGKPPVTKPEPPPTEPEPK